MNEEQQGIMCDNSAEIEWTVEEQQEPVYDDPAETEWTIGVDAWGTVFVLQAPNIDPWFLMYKNAEETGLPFETDWIPGIYRVQCKLKWDRSSDPYFPDYAIFEITSHTPIMQFGDKQLS